MPLDQKIGRGNNVVFKNAKFDFNELVNAFKFWSKKQGYHIFKVDEIVEFKTSKGIKMDVSFSFAKNIDYYSQSKFDIKFKARRCKKVTGKNKDGKLKTLYEGNFVATIDSKIVLDYANKFTNKGKFVDYFHHFFYEFIYEPRFVKYKVNTGINTGKSMDIIKDNIKKNDEFKIVSFS